jgi:hypothetical protein
LSPKDGSGWERNQAKARPTDPDQRATRLMISTVSRRRAWVARTAENPVALYRPDWLDIMF